MDSDNSLQINIEAIDDASAVLEGVAEATAAMADSVSESALMANGSLGAMEESIASLGEVMSVDSAAISDEALAMGVSFDEAATMIVEANTEAEASLAGVGEESALAAEEGSVSWGEFKSNLLQIGIVAGIAFLALKNEIKNASADSADWQGTLAVLNKELQNTGSSIPIDQLIAYTRTMQDTTLFQQQQVLDAEKVVMAHKDLQAGYQRTVSLSADLATFMKSDLPTAANALATALDNPQQGINRLGREMGGPFSDAVVSAIQKTAKAGDIAAADARIYQELEKSVKGVAVAAGNTDPLTKLGNEMHTLNTIIGDDLNKQLAKLISLVIPLIEKFEAFAAAHPKLVANVLIATVAILGIIVALVALGLAVAAIVAAWDGLVIVAGIVMTIIAAIGAPIIIVGALLAAMAIIWITQWGKIKDGMGIVYDQLKIWFKDIMDWVNTTIAGMQKIASGIGSSVSHAAGAVGGAVMNAIPHFAAGGIVNSPTLALVGESGPEMIVPLSMAGGGNSNPLPGGMGNSGGINVYITGQVYTTEDQAKRFGDSIAKQLNRQLKLASFR